MQLVSVWPFQPLPQRDAHGLRAAPGPLLVTILVRAARNARVLRGALGRPLSGHQLFWVLMALLLVAYMIALTLGGGGVWN